MWVDSGCQLDALCGPRSGSESRRKIFAVPGDCRKGSAVNLAGALHTDGVWVYLIGRPRSQNRDSG
jgi:hypothetical protein